MERKDVGEIVRASIEEVCGFRIEEETASLKTDCGLDSLSLVAVIISMEEKAGLIFDDGDLDPVNLTTIKDLVELLWKYV